MGRFNARAFADAAGAFNAKSVKNLHRWFAWKAAPVALAADTSVSSKFINLAALLLKGADFATAVLPRVSALPQELPEPFYSRFLAHPQPQPKIIFEAPAIAPVTKPESPRKILTLKAKRPEKSTASKNLTALFRKEMGIRTPPAAPVVPAMPLPSAPANQDQKPRQTLTLKSKVELPAFVNITRASSSVDLAGAFKAEMKIITERNIHTGTSDLVGELHAALTEKRRHPQSQKSWKELMAEAQASPIRAEKGFDLAGAFRREMQALLATDAKREAKTAAPMTSKPKLKPLAA